MLAPLKTMSSIPPTRQITDAMITDPHNAYDFLRRNNLPSLDDRWVARRIAHLLSLGMHDEHDAHVIATAELDTAYLGDVKIDSDLIRRNRGPLREANSSCI